MSATTKLPTPLGSVGTWGSELNDFLNQALVGSETANINNGLLKEDHAAVTRGGKVGVGTATPTNRLHITDTANPVKIEGLATGVTADDVVTISATGVLTKIAKSVLVPANSAAGTFNKVGTTTVSILETDDVFHNGKVGLGIIAPTNKLHVKDASNPVKIEGLATGVTADDVLTISSTGVVTKTTKATLLASSAYGG
jgi:hypothetical protein